MMLDIGGWVGGRGYQPAHKRQPDDRISHGLALVLLIWVHCVPILQHHRPAAGAAATLEKAGPPVDKPADQRPDCLARECLVASVFVVVEEEQARKVAVPACANTMTFNGVSSCL